MNDLRFRAATTGDIDAIANRVEDCWHGVWGGYSFESRWAGNRFARNAEGIAIEHGQNNVIPGLETDAQRAIQFVRSTPGIGTALIGMKSVAHVEEKAA